MDIKDKIAKLLALAGNNNSPEEAKRALLKARALMAEHKLRPEECQKADNAKVVEGMLGIVVSARKYAWAVDLSAVIAKNYCCIAFRRKTRGMQPVEIGILGLEDDFDIAARIFKYAFECVKKTADEIFEEDKDWLPTKARRDNAEAYGYSFCVGLKEAYERQNSTNKEWGLVMCVPQAVKETELGKKKPMASFGSCVLDP